MSTSSTLSFRSPEVQKALAAWFRSLEEDRGTRAELRRARNEDEAALCRGVFGLSSRLRDAGVEIERGNFRRLAAVAALTAHLKEIRANEPFARQLAAAAEGKRSPMSPLRFRRLLAIEDRSPLFLPLVRALRLLDGKANLFDLADSFFFWGPKVRRDWAYSYYSHLS